MGLEPGTNRTIITFSSSLYVTDGRPGQVLPTYMMTSSWDVLTWLWRCQDVREQTGQWRPAPRVPSY